jgi:hypothetical protein
MSQLPHKDKRSYGEFGHSHEYSLGQRGVEHAIEKIGGLDVIRDSRIALAQDGFRDTARSRSASAVRRRIVSTPIASVA